MTTSRVLVRTGSAFTGYTTVDPSPIAESALDEFGHLWSYDGGASDLDAPYSCLLCSQPQWRAYNEPCESVGRLGELNAGRAAWIAENRVDIATVTDPGFDVTWALKDTA